MKYTFYELVIAALLLIFNVSAQGQIISTVAGNGFGIGAPNDGAYAGDGGQATAAEFNGPWGVAVDDSGNVYIGDVYNNVIRKVTAATGIITTIGGDNTYGYNGDGIAATSAELEYPQDLTLDDSGNVYFCDLYNGRIRKITKATGIISTVAGDGTWGYNSDGIAATSAEINLPYTVAADDSGNIYIADTYNNRIRKVIKATGIITTIAGDGTLGYFGDGGQATAAEINQPYGVAVDDTGNIYIADSKNNVIRKVEKKTGIINTVAGNYLSGAGYSGDNGPATTAELNSPLDIAVDSSGSIYISDQYNNRIRRVSAGIITTFAGNGTGGYNGDGGLADTSEIYYSEGVAVDKCGNVYIGDYYNQRIRKVTLPDSIMINKLSAVICSGGNDTIAVTGATTYLWTPVTGLSDSTGSIVVANPTSTTTYTVTGFSSCFGATTPKTVVVNVNPAAPLLAQPQSPTICSGNQIILTVPASGTNYVWSPATGLNTTTGDTVIANPSVTTTYIVIGNDSSGCAVAGADTVSVVPVPNVPTISQRSDTLFSSAATENQWYENGKLINGADSSYLVIGQSTDTFTVVVINPADGCSSSSQPLITSGIHQLSINNTQLLIYPNPANETITININSAVSDISDWKLKLTDVLGQTIYTRNSLSYNNEIDLSELAGGVYFITVTNKTREGVFKVIKQ